MLHVRLTTMHLQIVLNIECLRSILCRFHKQQEIPDIAQENFTLFICITVFFLLFLQSKVAIFRFTNFNTKNTFTF